MTTAAQIAFRIGDWAAVPAWKLCSFDAAAELPEWRLPKSGPAAISLAHHEALPCALHVLAGSDEWTSRHTRNCSLGLVVAGKLSVQILFIFAEGSTWLGTEQPRYASICLLSCLFFLVIEFLS